MSTSGAWSSPRQSRHDDAGLVLVLIAAVDRRLRPALSLLSQLADRDARALHISLDGDEAHRLATAWIELGLDWLPLHIEEPTGATLVESVRHIVEREAATHSHVTVLVPEMDLDRWWQPILHRGMGRVIASQLQDLHRVTTVVLPVRVEDAERHHEPRPS